MQLLLPLLFPCSFHLSTTKLSPSYCVHLFFPRNGSKVWHVQVWFYVCLCQLQEYVHFYSSIWYVVYLHQNHSQFTCSYFLILLSPHHNPLFPLLVLHYDKYLTLSWDNNSPSFYAVVNGEWWECEVSGTTRGKGCSGPHYLWIMAPICISISLFGEPTTLVTPPSHRSHPM